VWRCGKQGGLELQRDDQFAHWNPFGAGSTAVSNTYTWNLYGELASYSAKVGTRIQQRDSATRPAFVQRNKGLLSLRVIPPKAHQARPSPTHAANRRAGASRAP